MGERRDEVAIERIARLRQLGDLARAHDGRQQRATVRWAAQFVRLQLMHQRVVELVMPADMVGVGMGCNRRLLSIR